MSKSKKTIRGLLIMCFGLSLLTGACHSEAEPVETKEIVYVPVAPDYTDPLMWHVIKNDNDETGADVFYIPSTWEFDWITSDGSICHYADPSRADHRADMSIEIEGVADYMADCNNFYSPFYRHITLDSWATLNEDTISRRYHDVAFQDVKAAFDFYLKEHNADRPFILAGFSQGGKSVVELLKTLDENTRNRMVAAYVMGYKVTPDDIVSHPYIKGATDSIDIGTVICYNSVSDVKYTKPVVATPNAICINPVNWKTDATPAVLDDSITVILDPNVNVLVVKGYDGSSLPNILDILNTGDYHGAEPWLYSECLRKNFRQRIQAWRKSCSGVD